MRYSTLQLIKESHPDYIFGNTYTPMKEKNNSILKDYVKDFNRHFITEDIWMTSKNIKKGSIRVIAEWQIKTSMSYHTHPNVVINKTDHNKLYQECGTTGTLMQNWWELKEYNHYAKVFCRLYPLIEFYLYPNALQEK